jgi:hypothetical protein
MSTRTGGSVFNGPVAREMCGEDGDIVRLGEFECRSETNYAGAGDV